MADKRSLKAFTIMELTVAMVISALVISIAYTSYGIVSRSFINFRAKSNKMDTLMLIDRLIKRDFEKAQIIQIRQNSIVFHGAADSVKYNISANVLVREGAGNDTFKFNAASYNVFYNGVSVKPDEDDADTLQTRLIDALSLKIKCFTDSLSYGYHKVYSSVNLFNQNSHATN